MKAYQLKAAIKKSKPLIWRRCVIPAGITYSQLSILLASLMEEEDDKDFEFEFFQKIRFREDDGIRPFRADFYYDLAEASEQYIDELLDTEKWFSFYYGTELALRVTIEKRLNFCGEGYPVVLAGRGVINAGGQKHDNLQESLQKKQEQWKRIFMVSYGAPEYRKRDEIRKKLADGQWGLHGCIAATSDSSRTCHSGKYYLEAFSDQFKELIKKKAGREGEIGDEEYEEELIRLLLEKHVQPAAARTQTGNPNQTEGKQQIQAPKLTLKDTLLNYSKEELKGLGIELCIRGSSSLNKDMLAEKIANELLMGDVMRKRFLTLRDEEISAWEECIRYTESFSPSADILELLERIYDRNYLIIYDDDYVDIPADVIQKYHKINTPEFQSLRKRMVWMLECLKLHTRIYGIAPVSVMIRMYRKRPGFRINREEWCELFSQIPWKEQLWVLDQDKVITKEIFAEKQYKKIEAMQDEYSRDFCIPDAEEIMDCGRNRYPSLNVHYQKLKLFFKEKQKLEEQRTNDLLRQIWNYITYGYAISEIIDRLSEKGICFSDDKELRIFIMLLQEANYHTRMLKNRGYTPDQLYHMRQQENGFGGVSPANVPAPAAAAKASTKRIYPNDPCPCGSGKKYKKCCGR